MKLKNSRILITGATGSLGRALVKRIFAEHRPKKVIVYSRDEFKQSEMRKEFPDPQYNKLRFFIGDVRDRDRLIKAMSGVDFVIHAAALKQVPALEYNPSEAIKTNIIGSQNVIDACIECGVEKAILISSDKAVNPINLYGATKLCAEKLFTAANAYNKTAFCSVRYGNVIGSRGSVIPFFLKIKQQADSDSFGKVPTFPVTDVRMTRFWITLDEAVDLVITALRYADKGKILVPRIPSMKIVDIAKAIDPNCDIKDIGIRAGEKLHECLVSEDNENVCIVKDGAIYPFNKDETYTSNGNSLWLSAAELREKVGLNE